jgi:phytanoyl-CoA hydroxylase
MLTSEQLSELERDGFTVLSQYFPIAEMAALESAIMPYHDHCNDQVREKDKDYDISRADEIVFRPHLALENETIRDFCAQPKLALLAASLLGPDIDLYWDQSVFKYPENQKEFPWHQDDGYTAVTPSPYLTCWIALNDATVENGCISVLPGHYKRGLLPHKKSPIGLVCHDSSDPDQGIRVPVKAGSVVAFWSLTPHKSGANLSDKPRNAYIVQYSVAGLRYKDSGELIPNQLPIVRNGKPVQRLETRVA